MNRRSLLFVVSVFLTLPHQPCPAETEYDLVIYGGTSAGITAAIQAAKMDLSVVLIEPGPVTSLIRQNAVKQFERWIEHDTSARADDYARLRHRLYGPPSRDPFELPPEAVAKKLEHALTSSRPRPRYYVTTPTYLVGMFKRVLSTRALDAIVSRGG